MATITLDGTSGFIEQFGYYAKAITKSDADVYDRGFYVYVGVAGDVAVLPEGSATSVTFAGMQAGCVLPCKVKAVLSTGTTASSLVALS